MAEKRMFSKKIIDTDLFMDMPATAQNLYFHLSMRADDDGFVASPKRVMKIIGANEDDFKLLVLKKFIIPFDSGVCVITDWRINNYLRSDRHTDTIYKEEKSQLYLNENNKYILGCQSGIPVVDTDKNNLIYTNTNSNNNTIIEKKPTKKEFAPPTFEEVLAYAKERHREDMAKPFYDYFTASDWVDSKGQKVRKWKGKFITWENFYKGADRKSKESTALVGRNYTDGELKELFDNLDELDL